MKIVLVPTDFSDNAFVAARYAATWAARRNWQLVLCHAYCAFSTGFQSGRQNMRARELAVKEANAGMQALLKKLQKQVPSANVSGQCVLGNTADVILEQVKQKKAQLIVMGTKGASGLKYILLGSNTFEVIRRSTVPVLAVPEKIKTFQLRKVGFAINYHAAEIPALEDFIDLTEEPLQITLFHLYEKGKREQEQKMALWKRRFKRIASFSSLDFKLQLTRNLPSGIQRFAVKEKLDALVMTSMDKYLFNRVFARKLVKVIAHHPVIPVFFMKGEKK